MTTNLRTIAIHFTWFMFLAILTTGCSNNRTAYQTNPARINQIQTVNTPQRSGWFGSWFGNTNRAPYDQNQQQFNPQNNFNSPQIANNTQVGISNAEQERMLSQVRELNSRLGRFDSDNQDLHTQIAQLQQEVNLANEEKRLLRQQLGDTASQLREIQVAKSRVDQSLNAMQASARVRGASIRANNSLSVNVAGLRALGVEAWQDGDVVRIALPTDRLFMQGTSQVQQTGAALLQQVAGEIRRNYPRQIVVIEGHTDNVGLAGTVMTHHQIAQSQSLAVFNFLSRSGYLPAKQMVTMAVGSNRPRFSNSDAAGRSRNRRVEMVVYPEAYDGN